MIEIIIRLKMFYQKLQLKNTSEIIQKTVHVESDQNIHETITDNILIHNNLYFQNSEQNI